MSIIAEAHWDACSTCKFTDKEGGCIIKEISVSLYDGDIIICDNYESIEDS